MKYRRLLNHQFYHLKGMSTLRAFGKFSPIQAEYRMKLDHWRSPKFLNDALTLWYEIRVDVHINLALLPVVFVPIFVHNPDSKSFLALAISSFNPMSASVAAVLGESASTTQAGINYI